VKRIDFSSYRLTDCMYITGGFREPTEGHAPNLCPNAPNSGALFQCITKLKVTVYTTGQKLYTFSGFHQNVHIVPENNTYSAKKL